MDEATEIYQRIQASMKSGKYSVERVMRILNAHPKEDRPKVAEGMIASYVRIYDQVANTPAPSHECREIREQVLVLLQDVLKALSK